MSKRSSKLTSKFIAVVASVVLVVALLPTPALAAANLQAAEQGDANGSLPVTKLVAQRAELAMQSAVSLTGNEDKSVSVVREIIEGGLKQIPVNIIGYIGWWGAEQVFNKIFGDDSNTLDTQLLQEILAGISQLQKGLDDLQVTVNSQELDSVLNDLKPLLSNQTTYDVCNALSVIDKKFKNGEYGPSDIDQHNNKYNARAEHEQLMVLTNGLGISESNWESVQNDYDKFVLQLWTAMTDTYYVTMNGQTQDLTLMQIFYEHLRYKYHWEHQAYEEWATFQSRCVGFLTSSLIVERASLMARIRCINNHNEGLGPLEYDKAYSTLACESRLKTIQDYINQLVGDYHDTDARGNHVDYQGIFGKKTWDSQYWMFKKRDNSERYYWHPGHELLLYSKVHQPSVPIPPSKGGTATTHANELGLESKGNKLYPDKKFWKPFFVYDKDKSLVAYTHYHWIYDDYNSSGFTKNLYDIFFTDGDFQDLDESARGDNKWMFMFDADMDDDIGVYHDGNLNQLWVHMYESDTTSDTLPKAEKYALINYWLYQHFDHTERNMIGIGLKRIGPETYDPDSAYSFSLPAKARQTVSASDVVKTYGDAPFKLDASSSGPGMIKYKSLNKDVIDVDKSGMATIVGAGSAQVIVTAEEISEYAPASKTITVTVNKATNPLTMAKKTVNLKASKLKRAKKTFAIKKAKGAQGTVSYSISKAVKGKKSFKKMFKINKTSGKITARKGLTRGTYKIKVKAKAAGNENYLSGAKNAVITVNVK